MIFKKKIFFILVALLALLVIIILHLSKPEEEEIIEEKRTLAKVAIVLDDFGYNINNLDLIRSIKEPLTLSILPNLYYSKAVAVNAARDGHEIILHLPLESKEEDAPMEADTIYTSMAEGTVLEKLNKAFDNVPLVKGISNHMGSKATEDNALMRLIFNEIKKKNLYFLDSLASGRSICRELAKDMGIRFAERDVYLDNVGEASYIKNQLKALIDKAIKDGSSIGIGHDRALTVKILAEEMPKLGEKGIEFVFLSELARQY